MQTSKIYKAGSLDDLIQVSEDILLQSKLRLWLLTGDLGAGKTTLIKAVLKNLNSMDEGSSPSYALINQYKTTSQPIYHIDLYRLLSNGHN